MAELTPTIELEASVGALDDLAPGSTVSVTLGETSYPGEIQGATPEIRRDDSGEKVAVVIVTIDGPLNGPIVDGEAVTVAVTIEQTIDSLLVPAAAIHADSSGGVVVTAVTADDTTEVPVVTGAIGEGMVEIIDGELQPGDQVVLP